MSQGYVFLGSEDEEFNRRFTLDHFELIDKKDANSFVEKRYDSYLSMLNKSFDELTDDELYELGQTYDTGRYQGKQIAYCLLHCLLCQKINLDMSRIYCSPCEFNYKKYMKKVAE